MRGSTAMAREQVVRVDELSRHFGDKVAVDRVSFDIARSEVIGFLGPNGAGKTTTIKMLTTLLPPTSGRATVLGHDLKTEGRKIRAQNRCSPATGQLRSGPERRDQHGYLRSHLERPEGRAPSTDRRAHRPFRDGGVPKDADG